MSYSFKKTGTFITITAVAFSILTLTPTFSQAKSTYKTVSVEQFREVQPNKTVHIFSKPSANSKKYVKLPKNSGVVVTGQTKNGFSKIRYQFQYAYVKTSALKKVSAKTGTHYARDISKKYRYDVPMNAGSIYARTFTASFLKTYKPSPAVTNFWFYKSSPTQFGITEYDTSKGLYTGDIEDGYLSLSIKYPIKKNLIWSGELGQKTKITQTKATVKTKAGTFKNVVVTQNGKMTYYYAPNKGLIQTKDRGKTFIQLTK